MKAAPPASVPAAPEVSALKELNKLKTVLLNTAAHELSTPLMPIQLQLSLLKGERLGALNEKQRESLDMVERNVLRLSQLIHDLLDVAQIEANRLAARRERMDINAAATQAVEAAQVAARQAQVRFILKTGRPLLVDADPKRIAQLFQALLGNAIKFTPAGGQVTVQTRDDKGVAICEISDTGVGLNPDDFGKLFQPFGQAFDTMEKTQAGAGLGLAISQGIIEQHGGRIWCDSAGPNRGATFAFALTLANGDKQGATDVMRRLAERIGVVRKPVERKGPLLYFKCPSCRSADIHMRIIKNKYDCARCGHIWR